MAKRKRYTDKFRASAVVMLEAAGYPDTKGALSRTAEHLKVPAMTLSRWFKRANNPPPNELVTEKKGELADIFEDVAYLYLGQARQPDVIDETRGRDAVMTAAVATDKMRLLRGLPTEIIGIIPDFVQAMNDIGKDPVDVLKRLTDRARHEQRLQ